MRRLSHGFCTLIAFAAAACNSTVRQLPGKPPSPSSISKAEPGGDAADPHWAALTRQLEQPWGSRQDKDHQLAVPFPDAKNWKRVRFWGVEHFTGFRYGDEHHAVAAAFLRDVPVGHRETSQSCMRRFEAWAQPKTRAYQFKLGEFQTHRAEWRKMPVVVRTVDGHVDFAFSRIHFSAAWAAYPAYPDACLVYAVAVPWDEHPELARAVRDRWVDEGFARTQPLTESRPFRKE